MVKDQGLCNRLTISHQCSTATLQASLLSLKIAVWIKEILSKISMFAKNLLYTKMAKSVMKQQLFLHKVSSGRATNS